VLVRSPLILGYDATASSNFSSRTKGEVLWEGSRKRSGSEFQVNGPATAIARPPWVIIQWPNCQLTTDSRTKMLLQLVPSVRLDTVEQCRPDIDASSQTVCIWSAQARQANEDRRRVVAATDHGQTSSRHWPHGRGCRIRHCLQFVDDRLWSHDEDNVTVVYPGRHESVHEC